MDSSNRAAQAVPVLPLAEMVNPEGETVSEKCNISPAEDHQFRTVKITWQTVDFARYQILNHSKERLVCERCGKIVDAFPEVRVAA